MIWQQTRLHFDRRNEHTARFAAPGLKTERVRMRLVFGQASAEVLLLREHSTETKLTLGRRATRMLRLPERERIGFRIDVEKKELLLGPLFAILTTSGGRSESLFGKRTGTCREILSIAEERGMVGMVLTERSQISPKQAEGFLLRDKQWQRQIMPLPQVTYDRLATRGSVSRHKTQGAARLLRKGLYFNPDYLDKWQTYQQITALDEYPGWPKTRQLSVKNLIELLREYPRVYLKPAASSLGLGIMTISRESGEWLLQHHVANGRVSRYRSPKLSRLWQIVEQVTRHKRYIVQQGIELLRYRQAPFDVRVLAQKDGDAVWRVMGMAARVAARGGIVTHVPNGGTRLELEQVLPAERCEETRRAIERVVLDAAKRLSEHTEQLWGELSFDVGIDTEGNPWILEINSHPFRFDERQIRLHARSTLLEFISFLAADALF